jgi:hypothetical protein
LDGSPKENLTLIYPKFTIGTKVILKNRINDNSH